MSFNFDKLKKQQNKNEDGSIWSSYSDLFMVLSLVFLLLYVVASIRTSTTRIKNVVKYKKLASETDQLRSQNLVYSTLKDEYLKTQASKSEQEIYRNLMKHITLLQSQAQKDKKTFREKAIESEEKEKELNNYQKIVRNIINTNILAQNALASRDKIIKIKRNTIKNQEVTIAKRDAEITSQHQRLKSKEKYIEEREEAFMKKSELYVQSKIELTSKIDRIKDLESMVKEKQEKIDNNTTKIAKISNELEENSRKLKYKLEQNSLSEKNYQEKLATLESQSKYEIAELRNDNLRSKSRIKEITDQFSKARKKQRELRRQIVKDKTKRDQKIEKLDQMLAKTRSKYLNAKAANELQGGHLAQLKGKNLALSDELDSSRLDIIKKQQELQNKSDNIVNARNKLDKKLAEIRNYESKIFDNEQTINKNFIKMDDLADKLEAKSLALSKQMNDRKMNKKQHDNALKQAREKYEDNISDLEDKNKVATNTLKKVSKNLDDATDLIKDNAASMDKKMAEVERLSDDLNKANNDFNNEVAKIKDNFGRKLNDKDHELAGLKSDFDVAKNDIAALGNKLNRSAKNLVKARKAKDDYKKYIDALKKKNQNMADDLKKAGEDIRARKRLIAQLKDNFKQSGISADIDSKSGDMIISFGRNYFPTGKASLNGNMRKTLEKFVPIYAKSLFQNRNIAKNISSVEIIGFSSPTYRGKFIDPQSLREGDREAVNYNLDLSYQRARSIFQHIFDTKMMKFKYQQKLLKSVKVTGRSFLSEDVKGRSLRAGLTSDELCKKFNCTGSQKVIIKFNMEE
ncbi:hypothetical protein OAB57_00220 [Bacteriovoracaceae bacterium]|nr:hypothetical protein [Bacteriovoracaceae bacterium]